MTPGGIREQLSALCYVPENGQPGLAEVEAAFLAMVEVAPLEQKMRLAQKEGRLSNLMGTALFEQAHAEGIITQLELTQLQQADKLRQAAIAVDSFAPDTFNPVIVNVN